MRRSYLTSLLGEAMIMVVSHIQAGVPVVVKGAEGFAISIHIDPVQLCRLPQIDILFYDFKNRMIPPFLRKNGGLPDLGQAAVCVSSYAVLISYSGAAGVTSFALRAAFRIRCPLRWPSYLQSTLQYFYI